VIFSSFRFLLFFPLVLLLYFGWRRPRYRQWMLLLASYVFYASWDWRFLFLIIGSTAVDYVVGLRLAATERPRARRAWLGLSLAANLGVLGTFKYADFFLGSLHGLLATLGLGVGEYSALNLILPVGISFYTFQTMSYSLDIYRRKLQPTRDPVAFALFVAFFPQLVAGPIVRAVELLPQIVRGVTVDWGDVAAGLQRFLIGFIKKVLIADSLAPYVDRIFADPGAYDGISLWVGSIGFAVQVYCDFAGYTDMAIGCGRLMGFRLPENFRWPFLSANVAEFWRRWHITLYSFMRDYVFVYIALGGKRISPLRQLGSLMITMGLIGLWHGAAWNFVVWGLYNGVLIVLYRVLTISLYRAPRIRHALATRPGTLARFALTNALLLLSFQLFRSQGLGDALVGFGRMLSLDAGRRDVDPWALVAFAAVLAASLLCEFRPGGRLLGRLSRPRLAVPLQALGYALVLVVLALFSPHDTQAFVYFQF
jgi:alginate O-acetyltransferase complex protein AlgI